MLILYLKIQCGISQIWCYQIYLVIPMMCRFPDALPVSIHVSHPFSFVFATSFHLRYAAFYDMLYCMVHVHLLPHFATSLWLVQLINQHGFRGIAFTIYRHTLRQWFYNSGMAAHMRVRGGSFKKIWAAGFNDTKLAYLNFLLGIRHQETCS